MTVRRAVRLAGTMAIVVGLGLTGPRPAFAIDPTKTIEQLSQEIWQVEHGLPQESIRDIAQTSDGHLWLSTWGGVARFDGVAFTRLDRTAAPELLDDRLAALAVSRHGGLWIGAADSVVLWNDNQFIGLGAARSLATPGLRALHEDAEGTLWIGTADGLFRLVGQRIERHPDFPRGKEVIRIHRDRSGKLWVAATEGLWLLDGSRVVMSPADPATPRWVQSITEDRSGRVWLATGAGLVMAHDGHFTRHGVAEGLPTSKVNAVIEDKDGNIWIGTDQGLVRLRDGKFVTYGVREGLPDDQVIALFEDREGSLWAGTAGGLVRFTDRTLPVLPAAMGLSSSNTVCEDEAGALWIGTQGAGLFRWLDDRLTKFTTRDGLSSNLVYSVVPGHQGEIFVGTAVGLDRGQDGHFAPVQVDGKPFGRPVRALHRSDRGVVWAAGWFPVAVVRIENGRTTALAAAQGLPPWAYRAVHEDRQGLLWLGSSEGLVRYDGRAFTVLGRKDGLAGDRVQTITEGGKGTIWIGTGTGDVNRIRDGRIESFGVRHGLPAAEIHQILEDDAGDVWLSSYGGLLRISGRAFDDVVAKKTSVLATASYRASDRRRGVVCNGRTQPAGWKSRDGRLWFPTRALGVVAADPKRLRVNTVPPSSVIQRMAVDQVEVSLASTPRIGPGARWFEFQFAGLGLLDAHRVRHQVRLLGLEDAWRDMGSRRVVYYPDIPPGRYSFQVRAANSDGVWSAADASLAFQLMPRFTQTVWFYLLCALPFALVLAGVYRVRMVRLRAVYDAVLAERSRVARELHDRLLQGITAVTWQLENVAAKSAVSPEATRKQLDVARTMLGESLAEARRVVWDLRPEVGGRSELGAALSTALERLRQGRPVDIDFEMEGTPVFLSPAVQSHLFNMAQEAVTNALKHAEPRRVTVRLAYASDRVRLSVSDDGRGFDGESQPAGHFGLLGLRERAADMQATVTVDSRPGSGTRVDIVVPVHHG